MKLITQGGSRSLQIGSDYHSANYTSKNLDTWIYTNSSEVFLNFKINRLDKQSNKLLNDDFDENNGSIPI